MPGAKVFRAVMVGKAMRMAYNTCPKTNRSRRETMSMKKMEHICAGLVIGLLLFGVGAPAEAIDTAETEVPDAWAETYTPDELAAIERALWAANLTIEDLSFRKDYTEGYECFQIVLDMLSDPLSIAPDMDRMIAGIEEHELEIPSPFSEVMECLNYYSELDSSALYGATGSFPDNQPSSPDDLLEFLEMLAGTNVEMPFSDENRPMLREFIPEQMSWHDVFASPYSEEQRETWEDLLEAEPDDYLYALMSETDIESLAEYYAELCPDPREWLTDLPSSSFPRLRPIIADTEWGRIGLGSLRDDVWEGDFAVLIDPGGDDHYVNCRIGAAFGTEDRRYGYFVDLGGDDVYDCGDVNITLGAAVLGVAAFYDLGQGNDRYIAGSCSLGAAMCGIATFYDDGGSDIYEGKVFSQGAAGFGIGVMVDESVQPAPEVPTDEETPDPIDFHSFDNDRYYAWTNSQAFARTLGFAICSNERGNEIYEAGGVYLHAPLFADRYQSFSQGFAIGQRGIDYAGGIALIVDYDGNDRYLGDVYNQGVGYWYSAGLLYDGGGNDTYEMTQYGQGSGIHLAVGGLVDVSGNDSYTMHAGLGTGGSHDYAASMLHDRAGNDQYFGNTSCNGGSLTNSAVVFIDRSGNDTYAGRRNSGINFGRPARGFTSIGVLIDLAGEDDYLGIMDNGMLWTHTNVGVGWDIAPPPEPEDDEEATVAEVEVQEPDVPLPEIIGYEGELDQEVFDELWEISIRWEVGDNRYIVPHARDRLVAFGSEVLPYLSEEFDTIGSGLALRAFNYILGDLIEVDREGVIGILRDNLGSSDDMRRRVAMAEISELVVTELEDMVAEILDEPDPAMQRRAIGVIGALGSHAADDRLLANLEATDDEALVKVSMETLFSLDVYCYDQLRPLLDHPYISVRETLIGKLAGNIETYESDLLRELENTDPPSYRILPGQPLSIRGLRSVLKIFATSPLIPDEEEAGAISVLLQHEDWGVRADALRVVLHWKEMADAAPEEVDPTQTELLEMLLDEADEMLSTETDPYVLFVGNQGS